MRKVQRLVMQAGSRLTSIISHRQTFIQKDQNIVSFCDFHIYVCSHQRGQPMQHMGVHVCVWRMRLLDFINDE